MYFNKCKLVSLVLCLSVYSLCFAQQPTYSKEEKNRFRQFASGYRPETTEQYWEGIRGLEQLLADYPNTFLKGDISITLLNYYQNVTDDPHLLIELSDKMLALQMYSNGAYETATRVLVDKEVRSEKTLLYAQNALKEALQNQEKWETGRRELICRYLLARAHQLVGQHDRAVAEIKTVIRGWQTRKDLGDLELASRQASVDRAKTSLLQIYIDQKAWPEAYELASELLLNSVIRRDIANCGARLMLANSEAQGCRIVEPGLCWQIRFRAKAYHCLKTPSGIRCSISAWSKSWTVKKSLPQTWQGCSSNVLGGMVQPVH